MKNYYLCIGTLNLLYEAKEEDSNLETEILKLVNKGWCIDKRYFGNWYKVELFEENIKELTFKNNYVNFNDNELYKIFKYIKNMNFIGEVKNLGYRDDGDFFAIPLFIIIDKIVN